MEELKKEEEKKVLEISSEKKKENNNIFNYELKKSIEFEGKEYSKLSLDFGKLTGNDAIAIEEELEAQNIYIMAPETSRAYQARMAARAGNISFEVLEKLSFQDFNRITNAARNFLVGQEL